MCHFFYPAFVVQKPGWWSSTPTALATALLNGREVPIPDLVPKSCLKTLAPPSLGHNWKLHPIAIVKMFTFTWIYWYTLTRSSQKLLAWWSGRGFNLKAQLALDHEPCAAAVWSWEGHGLASAEAELSPTRWPLPKMSFHINLWNLPGGGRRNNGESSPEVRGKCRFVEMVSSPVSGTSVCWKKSLGCRRKFPITTWETCSAQSSSSLAGRVLSQETHCLCQCSWDNAETQPSSCQFNVLVTSSLTSPCQALVCAPFFGFN